VIGVEPVAWRRERAAQIGAETALDPTKGCTLEKILELTDGRGVDCALDCSGTVQGERLCIDAVRRRGKVAFIGECNQDLAIRVSPDFLRKGLMIVGTWCSTMDDQAHIMQVIEESPLVDLLVSHVMPMSRIQDAFELLASGECAKVVLNPWE
jgi:threonine dehydrogenase-like Zn-dependent dehydrogenase